MNGEETPEYDFESVGTDFRFVKYRLSGEAVPFDPQNEAFRKFLYWLSTDAANEISELTNPVVIIPNLEELVRYMKSFGMVLWCDGATKTLKSAKQVVLKHGKTRLRIHNLGDVTCSPNSDPRVMRVNRPKFGQEILDVGTTTQAA